MFKQRYTPSKALINASTLSRIVFQVGTIEKVSLLTKARKPSYEMNGNFGDGGGIKKSCGQVVRNYKVEELLNKQILAVSNFSPVRIAGVNSLYLTLGFFDENDDGQAIVITPVDNGKVENGLKFTPTATRVFRSKEEEIPYSVFEELEVKSATVIDIVTSTKSKQSYCVLYFGEDVYDVARIPGRLTGVKSRFMNIQVPVITNVRFDDDDDEWKGVNLMVFAFPIDDEKHVTLMKIDKNVRNNLDLF